MLLSLIAAYDKNRVIGHGGSIPWNIPADMKFFRETTMGKPVIMGRKTHESIGRALPKRLNVVVTRQTDYQPKGEAVVAESLEQAIKIASERAETEGKDEIFVIGGGELYRQALPLASKVYATEIEATFPGDAYFPELDPVEWKIEKEATLCGDDTAGLTLRFITYRRVS